MDKDSYSSLANVRYIELMFSLWAKDTNSVEKVNQVKQFDCFPMHFTKTLMNVRLHCYIS